MIVNVKEASYTTFTTTRRPKTTPNPKRATRKTLFQDSRAKVEEEESTAQVTEMVQKKTRSFRSDDRIQELIQELNELTDSAHEELWRTKEGHNWAATGNSKACHGSAVPAGRSHTRPRITGATIEKKKLRLPGNSVYFPHTAHGDEQVQQVYSELQNNNDRCRKADTHKAHTRKC